MALLSQMTYKLHLYFGQMTSQVTWVKLQICWCHFLTFSGYYQYKFWFHMMLQGMEQREIFPMEICDVDFKYLDF